MALSNGCYRDSGGNVGDASLSLADDVSSRQQHQVFDDIERFLQCKTQAHSTIGYLSPMEFERRPDSL
jgi:hypothetical protein